MFMIVRVNNIYFKSVNSVSMEKIKLGIIGCGKNFKNHLRVYSRNKHVDIARAMKMAL